MKNRKMINGIVLCLLFFQSCHNFEDNSLLDGPIGLIDNSENIDKLIQSFDNTLNTLISSDFSLDENELNEVFIRETTTLGVEMSEIEDGAINRRISSQDITFSEGFVQYSEIISNPAAYVSNKEYTYDLKGLVGEVKTSNLPLVEKQILVDNMMFMDSFVNWMDRVNRVYNPSDQMIAFGCGGWWSCWGRCVAGVAGSSLSGAVVGCAGVGIVGATIGAVGGVKGAAAGAIIGCSAGGILNGIGKGLEGYAKYCN